MTSLLQKLGQSAMCLLDSNNHVKWELDHTNTWVGIYKENSIKIIYTLDIKSMKISYEVINYNYPGEDGPTKAFMYNSMCFDVTYGSDRKKILFLKNEAEKHAAKIREYKRND